MSNSNSELQADKSAFGSLAVLYFSCRAVLLTHFRKPSLAESNAGSLPIAVGDTNSPDRAKQIRTYLMITSPHMINFE